MRPNSAPFYKALGDLIRRKRKALDLSQDRLARILGVTRAWVANIETGRQNLLVHQLIEVAAAFNMAPADFLVSPAQEPTLEKKSRELPLPKGLTSKQRAEISRLFSDQDLPRSRDDNTKE